MGSNKSIMHALIRSRSQADFNSALAEYGWAAVMDWEQADEHQSPNQMEFELPDEALHRLELSSFRDYGINE
jgi:hypothetical protein